jgi:hypothetical protein
MLFAKGGEGFVRLTQSRRCDPGHTRQAHVLVLRDDLEVDAARLELKQYAQAFDWRNEVGL